jgi:hypothetical protein
MADEFMQVVYKLWEGSWEDDAVLRDKTHGIFARLEKIHKATQARCRRNDGGGPASGTLREKLRGPGFARLPETHPGAKYRFGRPTFQGAAAPAL